MIGRALWFAAGTGAGVYGAVKTRRLAHRLSPSGLSDQVAAVGLGVRALVDDVRAGMQEREDELLDQLGLERPPPGRAVGRAHARALAAARQHQPVRRDAP